VVFSFVNDAVGVYSAKAAVKIAEALTAGRSYTLHTDIEEMRTVGHNGRV
jgi:hypothetical protein